MSVCPSEHDKSGPCSHRFSESDESLDQGPREKIQPQNIFRKLEGIGELWELSAPKRPKT
jgi:hypothetical protein